ncbi:MAG: glycoside hydrolase family 25 [Lachnospiraceae bacterium]|nr:glycoside hydrolase family 25 [Lachnospiraceae bacterium]
MKRDTKRKTAPTKKSQNEEILNLDMEDLEWDEAESEADAYKEDESDNDYDEDDWESDNDYDEADWESDDDEDDMDFNLEGIDRRKILFGMVAVGVAGVIALIIVCITLLRSAGSPREILQEQPELIENDESQFSDEEGLDNIEAALGNEGTENMDETGTGAQDAGADLTGVSDVQTEVSVGALDDEQDPQNFNAQGNEGSGAEVTVAAINENEISGVTIGIDVSKYQGTIDWSKVKESGVEFAMIRVGYRAKSTGEIFEDPTARYNMQEAQAAGIKIGAYFFSSAVTKEEARAEAAFTKDIIAKYRITYPVAYNCEDFQSADSRQYGLDASTRTELACAFLDEISAAGYTPMFYASKGELEGNAQWNTDTLSSRYKIWVAQYPNQPYPQTSASSYAGTHAMWQYTGQGIVAGISKKTDVNIAYFGYLQEAEAKDETPPETVEANPEVGIIFTEVNETVTAKQETNLRSEPSTLNDASIVTKLMHGDTATRTGIGHNGWSRVIYNGQTLYAVTSYLTTDMADTGQQAPPQGPVYTPVYEQVTAKIETNLRTEPSTASADTVVGVLHNGEYLIRTAVGDNGWSQLDFNGMTVYAVSSYLVVQ